MDSYFEFDQEKQNSLLETALNEGLGPNAAVLEKDIWLCLVLQELFTLPDIPPMVFKGGTSLSKVYNAIHRFSEDVDVTLDWRKLVQSPENLTGLGKNATNKLSKEIEVALQKLLKDKLHPALSERLERYGGTQVEFARDHKGEPIGNALVVNYPSVADYGDGYIRPNVLIEFGGRNDIEPGEERNIIPDVAHLYPDIDFPSANVAVLSPIRTFWEKATLAHDEAHRPADKRKSSERQSRHWYDLYRLADHEIGQSALQSRHILEQVVTTKSRFFTYNFSKYDACLTGEFRILPDEKVLASLKSDYSAMMGSRMFYGEPVAWSTVEDRLRQLELDINAAVSSPAPASDT